MHAGARKIVTQVAERGFKERAITILRRRAELFDGRCADVQDIRAGGRREPNLSHFFLRTV